jgi:hypothetical protein
MWSFLLVAIVIVCFKVFTNYLRLLSSRRLLARYSRYLDERTWELLEYQDEIVGLFKRAGIEDSAVPLVEPAGYGHVLSTNMSVFSNISNTRVDVASNVKSMFHRAIGIYRKRMWDAVSPIFWLELLINLPREAFSYVGIPPERALVKVSQILYWILGAGTSLVFSLFGSEFLQVIRRFVGS